MEEAVLLGTKSLVDFIRHFIRDPSGVFFVWHLCECRIVQWRHDSRLLLLLNWFLASRLFSLRIIKRTLLGGAKIWISCLVPLQHKIHIFSPPCNILYICVYVSKNINFSVWNLADNCKGNMLWKVISSISAISVPFLTGCLMQYRNNNMIPLNFCSVAIISV